MQETDLQGDAQLPQCTVSIFMIKKVKNSPQMSLKINRSFLNNIHILPPR